MQPAETTTPLNRGMAVIDIGTSAIRMLIADIGPKGEIRHIDSLYKPVRFGRDVFATGRISRKSMNDGLAILANFKTALAGYGVQRIQAVATSAVREALNSDNFIDRAFVQLGIDVEIIEGPEGNRLGLIAIEDALAGRVDLAKRNSLIVEVGSGSTELIVLTAGEVEITRTLSNGLLRLPEETQAGKTELATLQRVIKRYVRAVITHATNQSSLDKTDTFIALGGEMRFAAQQILGSVTERFCVIDKKAFTGLVTRLAKMTPEETAGEFNIPYSQAETLYVSMLFYAHFLNAVKTEEIIVPMVSIRDGLLLEAAQMLSGYRRTDVAKQVMSSARRLAERYKYDRAHSACVSTIAVKLFDLLAREHGMGVRERLLLEVAAVLHDIGSYISPMAKHKHSAYLVRSAEIFGLRKADKDVLVNVVRYHRGSVPKPTHEPYMSLPKADRAVVFKLAAFLRVANALDQSRQSRIRGFELIKTGDIYTLWVPADVGDISMERDSLKERSDMFVDVFGARLVLKQGRPA